MEPYLNTQIFRAVVDYLRASLDPGQEVEVFTQSESDRITHMNVSIPHRDPAAGRFWFKQGPARISVYYDNRNNLGFMPGPYFEIYPNKSGDAERFLVGDFKFGDMLKALQEAVREKAIRMVLGTE